MSKRLAITISGAVSLGSYEAGVLYEIIHALGQHNQHPDTTEAEKIYIDVLTGASAGGMTATIAAQKLAFDAEALTGPYDNCFYRPWVAEVSIDGLLALQGTDDPKKSILSSQHVVDLSKRHLIERYKTQANRQTARHPAAAPTLHLGLALANLNGIDYGLPVLPEKPAGPANKFIYTCHQDELVALIDSGKPETSDNKAFWEPLRNAAVSCGAFPFAFRVVDVARLAAEYQNKRNLETPIASPHSFTYTDGGTFQNEPLGLAKNLVDLIDYHLDVANRFYLFVAPGAKSSTANTTFNADKAGYSETLLRLTASIFEQCRFQDWITAERVNEKIAVFNQRADALYQAILADSISTNDLNPSTTKLLPVLFATEPTGSQAAAQERVRKQFAIEYDELLAQKGKATADTFVDTLLTLETAAHLGPQDEMVIYGITADDNELASYELFAFAGFFDRRYRDHDYEVGRQKAQDFLRHPDKLGPIRFTPEPLGLIDPALNGLKLEKMERSTREKVRDQLRARSHVIMKEAGIDPWMIGGVVRKAIDLAVVKPKLEKLLKL